MGVALGFITASAVSIRRAALVAMHSALQSYFSSFVSSFEASSTKKCPSTALDVLTNISMGGEQSGVDAMNIFEEPTMVAAVDWAASAIRHEADDVSRALLTEIVKMASESVYISSI